MKLSKRRMEWLARELQTEAEICYRLAAEAHNEETARKLKADWRECLELSRAIRSAESVEIREGVPA